MSDDEVTIEIEFRGTVTLKVDEVWPDGNAPEIVTADAVADVMESSGSAMSVLRDWALDDALGADVLVRRPNPAYGGNQVMFGDPPPAWLNEIAGVWS